MGDLSEHFSRREFAPAYLAVPKTIVDAGLIKGLESLHTRCRAKWGQGIQIIITSGFRPRDLDSQHAPGKAADFFVRLAPGRIASLNDLFEEAVCVDEFRFGGIGVYPDDGFLHCDVRGYKARWIRRTVERADGSKERIYDDLPDFYVQKEREALEQYDQLVAAVEKIFEEGDLANARPGPDLPNPQA